ncbi:hypothetical protein [Sorangium sp. So ce887]|uniref:hypothetical protein n=1 Tax=Sorangium sp. So ce887 TaxID=3133324 RepID=UPI003F5F9217
MNTKESYQGCAFYVQAHQDDWQFFFGEKAWVDLSCSSNKIIFIYTTAGDGDPRDKFGAYHEAGWWESRECGALASSLRAGMSPDEFASILSALPDKLFTTETVSVNNHQIIRREWRNTRSYFLRIPSSSGLEGLHRGEKISALDGSASYAGWEDFGATLSAIICQETPEALKNLPDDGYRPWIIVSDDDDVKYNPLDHPDHHQTSLAVKEFVAPLGDYNVALYQTYYNNPDHSGEEDAGLSNLLSEDKLRLKRDLYYAYRDAFKSKLQTYGGNGANLLEYCNDEWSEHYGPKRSRWRIAPRDWGRAVVIESAK